MPQAAPCVAGTPATCCPQRFLGNRGGQLGHWAQRTLLSPLPWPRLGLSSLQLFSAFSGTDNNKASCH